jgi:hypothetical protein
VNRNSFVWPVPSQITHHITGDQPQVRLIDDHFTRGLSSRLSSGDSTSCPDRPCESITFRNLNAWSGRNIVKGSAETSRWLLGIVRPDIDSMLRDSGLIIPSRYSGPRDVRLPAGISIVNRSSSVEGFTKTYDRSSIPIKNPSLCENKDCFEHKMYQQRFTSHALGAHYGKTILLRDWDLNARFSMVYRNNIQNFTQTHNAVMVMHWKHHRRSSGSRPSNLFLPTLILWLVSDHGQRGETYWDGVWIRNYHNKSPMDIEVI